MSVLQNSFSYSSVWFLTGEEEEEVYSYPSADPYMGEDKAFLDAVRSGDSSAIQSSYSDAAKTYQLSWDIRRSSEQYKN